MGNLALLVLMMGAFGLTSSRRMFRKCTFCRYFFDSGNSPYELLWILSDEISSYLTDDQRITLFLDDEDLTKAELVFELYCERTCTSTVLSEVAAEVGNGDPHGAPSTANETSSAPCIGSAKFSYKPSGARYRFSSQNPKVRTLFTGLKINKQVESAGGFSRSGAPLAASQRMSEGLAVGASVQTPGGYMRMNAGSSGTNGEEKNTVGLEYTIPGILVHSVSSVESTGSPVATTGTFSDGSDEYKNTSQGLSSDEIKYPNATRINDKAHDKGGATVADSK